MDKLPISRADIEAIAESIGAPKASVFKWRKRGIPGAWQMRIVVASEGRITAQDMLALGSPSPPLTGAAA